MIHYNTFEISSDRPWVTFVHGAGGSSNIWFKQLRSFRQEFNILLLDLRGHGGHHQGMPKDVLSKKYTFDSIAQDIIEVMDHLKIEKSHFIGISLGSILIRHLAEKHPDRVASMILGGAILEMNAKSKLLIWLGNNLKHVFPYLVLYRFFAFAIMPKKNHKQSRNLFIQEAKKLYQKEFLRWFKLTAELKPLLKWFRQVELPIPTLYIMGEEDYLFLPSVREVVSQHQASSKLHVIPQCGHVVNVEQPSVFNQVAMSFISNQSR